MRNNVKSKIWNSRGVGKPRRMKSLTLDWFCLSVTECLFCIEKTLTVITKRTQHPN